MVCYHPVKIGDYRHCANKDIMILVFHVILQDHVMKG